VLRSGCPEQVALSSTARDPCACRGEVLGDRALGNPDRVRDAVILELATTAQPVNGRGGNLQARGDIPNRELPRPWATCERLLARVSKGVSKELDFTCGSIRWVRVVKFTMCSICGPLRLAAAHRGVAAPPSGAEGHGFESRIAPVPAAAVDEPAVECCRPLEPGSESPCPSTELRPSASLRRTWSVSRTSRARSAARWCAGWLRDVPALRRDIERAAAARSDRGGRGVSRTSSACHGRWQVTVVELII
jgi:hypothetical protein